MHMYMYICNHGKPRYVMVYDEDMSLSMSKVVDGSHPPCLHIVRLTKRDTKRCSRKKRGRMERNEWKVGGGWRRRREKKKQWRSGRGKVEEED